MKFVSARKKNAAPSSPASSFSEAVKASLAPDGGLFCPRVFPSVDPSAFMPLVDRLPEFAERLLKPFFAGDPLEKDLGEICARALNFSIPLKFVGEQTAVLELFHGPTCSFKDVGARFLAECLSRMPSDGRARTIVVATSGDTGGAVASAFDGRSGFEVVILFPDGKISARQEKQLTCWGDNVRAFAVRGTFDDCQRVVKQALANAEFAASRSFASANSINVGRLLPQTTFHARASVAYFAARGRAASFIVPTGNLGDAVAALWAKRMGFPIGRAILATNANQTLKEFFASGRYAARPSTSTLANAMDVGDPSNVERLIALYDGDLDALRRDVSVESASDDEISRAIAAGERKWGEVWCPHTAAAVVALERQPAGGDWIIAATAHPAKFESTVEPLIGHALDVPPPLAELLHKDSRVERIGPSLADLLVALKSDRS